MIQSIILLFKKQTKILKEYDLGKITIKIYIINLKTVRTKDKLMMGSRLTLVEPKRFADGLDLGYKRKRIKNLFL